MDTDDWYTLGFVLFLGIPILPIFFSPTIIAVRRQRKIGIVLFCNLFLGWTLLGWGLAMAIAIDDR